MHLYIDLDGVLTDFDRQLAKILGEPVKKDWGNSPRVWSAIDRAGTKFWATMKWLPGSNRLWDELKKFDPTILSSPSRHQSSIDGKKEWLEDNLPGVPFIIEQEKEKYAAPDAILIDDREKNIKKWEEKGGIGILHKSVPETLIQFADAIQNLDKNVKKASDKGYVKFYKDSSNPKGLYALANDTVFSVNANKGYPLFEASKTKLDDFRGSVQKGKYLEIPFSRVLDYPTEGEGTTFTPYTASSKYKINWKKPDVSKEAEEYFNNAVTYAAFLKEKVKFKNIKEFEEKFKKGKVEDLPVTGLQNITTSPEDFQRELNNPEYRASYDSLKKELMNKGNISLEMPIIVKLNDDKYWGFSGNRRTNLAFEFGIPVKVWMVELK